MSMIRCLISSLMLLAVTAGFFFLMLLIPATALVVVIVMVSIAAGLVPHRFITKAKSNFTGRNACRAQKD